jgi:MoaA/NifB/PqqE/SkfB family radical SAM enzyme
MSLIHLFKNGYPALDWIQVEISSYCNAMCIYCPHTVYRKNWQNRYLPIDAFQRLMPAFRKTNLVYLQGWGEPFTNPLFLEMLKLAKSAGCCVGTTTNGTLLNRDLIEKLVAAELDVIGFSLAGMDEKNDAIRKGAHIKAVFKCVEEIHRAKQKYGTDRPAVHIAYMLLNSRRADLDRLPEFFENLGVDQAVVSSLSFVADPAMEAESKLASGRDDYLELKRRLLKVRHESASRGADVHFHLVSPVITNFACSENVPRAAVIGSDGSVSPCVMKQMPVQGENYHYVSRQQLVQQNLSFGNIRQAPLNTIWHREEYRQFTKKNKKNEAPLACQKCCKGYIDNF